MVETLVIGIGVLDSLIFIVAWMIYSNARRSARKLERLLRGGRTVRRLPRSKGAARKRNRDVFDARTARPVEARDVLEGVARITDAIV